MRLGGYCGKTLNARTTNSTRSRELVELAAARTDFTDIEPAQSQGAESAPASNPINKARREPSCRWAGNLPTSTALRWLLIVSVTAGLLFSLPRVVGRPTPKTRSPAASRPSARPATPPRIADLAPRPLPADDDAASKLKAADQAQSLDAFGKDSWAIL